MMPIQVTTTQGAHVQAAAQKLQARALPRTPGADAVSGEPGAPATHASAQAQDFRAFLRRIEAERQERPRGIAS